MDKQQKLFLNDFHMLCKKYKIEHVCVFNGAICFQRDGDYISFVNYNYVDGVNAIYNNILIRQDDYEITPEVLIEGD